jgi:hypothetical protein
MLLLLLSQVTKLFKNRNRLLIVTLIISTWNHMTAQKLNDFGIGHFIVVKWINFAEKIIDFIFVFDQIHSSNKLSELLFVQNAVFSGIDFFKQICKFLQKLFVFLKLEIKYDFLKISINQFSLIFHSH